MFFLYRAFQYNLTTHSSTYKTAYTDACKTHYTTPVYITVFPQVNPRVRNV